MKLFEFFLVEKNTKVFKIVLVIGVLVGVAGAGLIVLKMMRNHAETTDSKYTRRVGLPMPVSSVFVKRAPLDLLISAECVSKESLKVSLASEGEETVARVMATIGDHVQEKKSLLEFDNTRLNDDLHNALEGQEAAKSLVDSMEPYLVDIRKLRKNNLVPLTDLLKAIKDTGQARLDLIRATKETIRVRYKLKNTKVFAPMDGVVTALNVGSGSTPRPFEELMVISRLDPIQLECAFAEDQFTAIKGYQKAEARFSSHPDKLFPVTLDRVLPYVKKNAYTLAVLFNLSNPDQQFLPGMQAVVRLGKSISDLRIPSISLINPENGKANIFVVDGNDIVHFRKIKTGLYAKGYVQVLSGLAGGERVVVTGQTYLQDGDSVREGDETKDM